MADVYQDTRAVQVASLVVMLFLGQRVIRAPIYSQTEVVSCKEAGASCVSKLLVQEERYGRIRGRSPTYVRSTAMPWQCREQGYQYSPFPIEILLSLGLVCGVGFYSFVLLVGRDEDDDDPLQMY